jgi:hypothetical protein
MRLGEDKNAVGGAGKTSQTRARTLGECSPMPAVNTTAST